MGVFILKNNKFIYILITCLLLFSLSLVSCSNSNRKPVTIENIVTDLKANGYKVEVVDPSKKGVVVSFFSMSSVKLIYVNDNKAEVIVVNVFNKEEVAQQQAKTISKDGHIRNVIISGIHQGESDVFFVKDNLIVRCAKESPYTKQLKKLLGKPITE